jgi:hypothetical protein
MMGERFHIPAHSKVFGRLRDGISQAAANGNLHVFWDLEISLYLFFH